MAVQPWRGTRADWFEQNGWKPHVIAEADGFELRAFPASSTSFKIAAQSAGWHAGVQVSPDLFGGFVLFLEDHSELHGRTPFELFAKWLRQPRR